MLSVKDFVGFFEEVHDCQPFPWQERLLTQVAAKGEWPRVLDLPTGSGKTAAIDVAVFHLALAADRAEPRRAPVRIAFVVDRRLVVDDAFGRAGKLEEALKAPAGAVTARVAERLKLLSGDGPPLVARRLRGGVPREDDWSRTPSQPTVLCSTVDQVGSRLLFRGYGISDSMKPVHAGLIGSDCLILLDEAHLAEPFRQTLNWVDVYRGPNWRECGTAAPWGISLLTATPGVEPQNAFSLYEEDRSHPVLKKRLEASKPARLVAPPKARRKAEDAVETADEGEVGDGSDRDLTRRATTIINEVRRAVDHFNQAGNGVRTPAIGVVVNRVARARAVFERLREEFNEKIEDGLVDEPILMIGPARPVDRDDLAERLQPIRTGAERTLERALVLVATQCIEAGVDIDLDALITEVAPLDCLRQRFGRLNRAGRDIIPSAAIVATRSDVSARAQDPVYGEAIKGAWSCLTEAATRENGEEFVEFGLNTFRVRMEPEGLSPKEDAPILLPAHLDLLSQTSPVPTADPDVALYLHGPSRQSDSITVVWRADVEPAWADQDVTRLLTLVPPRSSEAIGLPPWAVRRWLAGSRKSAGDIPDTPGGGSEQEEEGRDGQHVFRWKGNDERSRWIYPAALRPGDTIIVPARYGGVDRFGWNPGCEDPAQDVARKAAQAFAGRRFVIRIAPGLLESVSDEALADALSTAVTERWQDLRDAVMALHLPEDILQDLVALDDAHRRRSLTAYLDLYGFDNGRPRGVVFVAPFGIIGREQKEDGHPNATEDDASGSIFGCPLSLQQHSRDVERKAQDFARTAGLPADGIKDLGLAGFLHDEGKRDPRFQEWLHFGDPLGFDPNDEKNILAKSGRSLPPFTREKVGLPDHWRHEALSVRLARAHARLAEAHDVELVLWLIGSHHGYGRPLFPHQDPKEQAPDIGPQSLAFEWNGFDWPSLFTSLKARYGVWELARMEAILRLADHRASEAAAQRNAEEGAQ
jgi:CRISPR-associated endonuclease/helicase Cas3